MKNKNFRLLVKLDMRNLASREMISGVLRYQATHPGIEVQFAGMHPSTKSYENFAAWKPHALITDSCTAELSDEDFTALAGKAVVIVGTLHHRRLLKRMTILTNDARLLAVSAYRHFRALNLENLAFIGAPDHSRWSTARERLFAALAKDEGRKVRVFRTDDQADYPQYRNALTKWLKALPKPCGLWCAFDNLAREVINTANLAGIAIPGELRILSVDNDPLICNHTSPTLSSIAPDFEQGGYQAVKWIFSDSTDAKLYFPLGGITERESTRGSSDLSAIVASAQDFISANFTHDISVDDIASAVRVNKRTLQRNFQAIIGLTLIDAIIRARLEYAKRLLRRTKLSVNEIARKCGFNSSTHLMTQFKQRIGITPTSFRQS